VSYSLFFRYSFGRLFAKPLFPPLSCPNLSNNLYSFIYTVEGNKFGSVLPFGKRSFRPRSRLGLRLPRAEAQA